MPKFPKGEGRDGGSGRRKNLPMLPTKIIEPRCHVCQYEGRDEVDKALLRGYSQASVCRYFQAIGAAFNRKNLSTHARNHLTLGETAMRALIEDEAKKSIKNLDDAKQNLVTKYAVLKSMMLRGFEDVSTGVVKVEARDLLMVVDKMETLEAEQEKVALDELMAQFGSFAEAVKEFVPEDKWDTMYERYRQIDEMRKGMSLEQLVTFEASAEEPLGELEPPDDDDDTEGPKP